MKFEVQQGFLFKIEKKIYTSIQRVHLILIVNPSDLCWPFGAMVARGSPMHEVFISQGCGFESHDGRRIVFCHLRSVCNLTSFCQLSSE